MLHTFTKCLKTFSKCLKTFSKCLKTFSKCLNTFSKCINTFSKCLKTFAKYLKTISKCLKTFLKCLCIKTMVIFKSSKSFSRTQRVKFKMTKSCCCSIFLIASSSWFSGLFFLFWLLVNIDIGNQKLFGPGQWSLTILPLIFYPTPYSRTKWTIPDLFALNAHNLESTHN